jgi:fructokinase
MNLRPEELDISLLRSCRALHFGTISLVQEPSRTSTLAAIEIAREHGALISCDPNLRLPLWPDEDTARHWMRKALEISDVAKLSAEEVMFLRQRDGLEALDEWYDDDSRPELSVVTCGSHGCFFAAGESCFAAHPGYAVDAVDATGAGDGFMAGFLSGLLDKIETSADLRGLKEFELTALCAFANAVGALTTTRKGAIPALPTAAEVETFLGSRTHPLPLSRV